MGRIWDDPWIAAACAPGGTRLPPPRPVIPDGIVARCMRWSELEASGMSGSWADLVGTAWRPADLAVRLEGAWIPLLTDTSGTLLATCVLRPQGGSPALWILETLTVAPTQRGAGIGALLMRWMMSWIWDAGGVGGTPFVLGMLWELKLRGLVGAWWSGWLRSVVSVERGWMWAAAGVGCGFCPADAVPGPPRYNRPTLFQYGDAWAIVNDSGRRDGWGHCVAWSGGGGQPWASIAAAGGWSRLWAFGAAPPDAKTWRWSGEFVVRALLNAGVAAAPVQRWITSEV